MTTLDTFQPKRFSHFVLRQITFNLQPYSLSIGGTFGTLVLISLAVSYFNPDSLPGLVSLYLFVLFLTGFIFTSRIFSELNKPQKSYAFLTLPVSNLEKMVGMWLLSSPIYVAVYLFLVSMLYWFSLWQADSTYLFGELFQANTFRTLGAYFISQTVFFLGACSFRNNHFFKTLFSLFSLMAVLALFSVVVLWMFFGRNINGEYSVIFGTVGDSDLHRAFALFVWFLLAPYLLLVSYFKLKERQA